MLTNSVGRRSLLQIAAFGFAAVPLLAGTAAAQLTDAPISEPVQRLNSALLVIMKSGRPMPFGQRYDMLDPVVAQTFDLATVLQVCVGPRWLILSNDERAKLTPAFRSYTVANYVANFDSFSGQSFEISPDRRSLPNGDRVVQTTIASPGKLSHTLSYVMRQTASGWKAVDVLAEGAISRVAVQRSDFRKVLLSGGGAALVTMLERKVADLSGGKLV